jgi:biotin carboxyl carrier protein
MYKLVVNEKFKFEIVLDRNLMQVNQQMVNPDFVKLSENKYHVLHQNKSYEVEQVSEDPEGKLVVLKVNGKTYNVAIEDPYDQLLNKLGLNSLTQGKLSEIKAPMPGLVLNVLVSVGQAIKKGDNLIVLEAMKMENMLKSPNEGVIQKVKVIIGDKVEKNQVLIQFEA